MLSVRVVALLDTVQERGGLVNLVLFFKGLFSLARHWRPRTDLLHLDLVARASLSRPDPWLCYLTLTRLRYFVRGSHQLLLLSRVLLNHLGKKSGCV